MVISNLVAKEELKQTVKNLIKLEATVRGDYPDAFIENVDGAIAYLNCAIQNLIERDQEDEHFSGLGD